MNALDENKRAKRPVPPQTWRFIHATPLKHPDALPPFGPGGTTENSPAFQHRVLSAKSACPARTAEIGTWSPVKNRLCSLNAAYVRQTFIFLSRTWSKGATLANCEFRFSSVSVAWRRLPPLGQSSQVRRLSFWTSLISPKGRTALGSPKSSQVKACPSLTLSNPKSPK